MQHGGCVLTALRLSGRQVHCYDSNPPSSTPEEYYRITLYDEFLSHAISELEERFVNNRSPTLQSAFSISFRVSVSNWEMMWWFLRTWQSYSKVICSMLLCSTWRMTHGWGSGRNTHLWLFQTQLIDALKECSILAHPNVNAMLILALIQPITSCESERSFSQLKLIKTAGRATMYVRVSTEFPCTDED